MLLQLRLLQMLVSCFCLCFSFALMQLHRRTVHLQKLKFALAGLRCRVMPPKKKKQRLSYAQHMLRRHGPEPRAAPADHGPELHRRTYLKIACEGRVWEKTFESCLLKASLATDLRLAMAKHNLNLNPIGRRQRPVEVTSSSALWRWCCWGKSRRKWHNTSEKALCSMTIAQARSHIQRCRCSRMLAAVVITLVISGETLNTACKAIRCLRL
jgi:hypothetical protein